MLRKVLFGIAIFGMLYGCATSSHQGGKPRKPTDKAPVIVDYYALDVIRPGDIWRFYLQAQDEDGDMSYIAALLYQPGVGYYPTSTVYLQEADRKDFVGYAFLITPADQNLTSDTLELTAVVWDQNGNSSKNVNLQLTFGSPPTETIPPKWQLADNHSLGSFKFVLRSSASAGK